MFTFTLNCTVRKSIIFNWFAIVARVRWKVKSTFSSESKQKKVQIRNPIETAQTRTQFQSNWQVTSNVTGWIKMSRVKPTFALCLSELHRVFPHSTSSPMLLDMGQQIEPNPLTRDLNQTGTDWKWKWWFQLHRARRTRKWRNCFSFFFGVMKEWMNICTDEDMAPDRNEWA